jgi:hypothetical protein
LSHPHGTYLGGIRSLDDLRARCRVDRCTGCWHLLRPDGSPVPAVAGGRHMVHVHGRGVMTSLRAAYELANGEPVPADRVVFRSAECRSNDCVSPLHIRRGTRRMAIQAQKDRGLQATQAKAEANRRAGLARSRLSAELREWIAESPQSGVELGAILEVAHTHISALRARMKQERPAA